MVSIGDDIRIFEQLEEFCGAHPQVLSFSWVTQPLERQIPNITTYLFETVGRVYTAGLTVSINSCMVSSYLFS
jgi:hypothetical protein